MDTATNSKSLSSSDRSGSTGVALLRITLGVILLVSWWDNLDKGLYSADGFEGFINYLFSAEGNNSSFTAYESFVENTIFRVSGLYVIFQFVVELAIAIGLLFGIFTRASSLISAIFFANLFLAYVGGSEWIWTYVLLLMAAVTVFMGYGGRKFGVDAALVRSKGESPGTLIW